jgi:hypothetical protein
MEIREKRKADRQINIDHKLIQDGATQLSSEVDVLESWLGELKRECPLDHAVADARVAYNDMLRSRREMLNALLSLDKSRN